MRSKRALAVGALLLLAALVLGAPATLLDSRLAALSDGHLRIANAAGTIWNGSGELAWLPAGPREPVRWRLAALPLLQGEVRVAIATDSAGAPGATLVYGHDRFELSHLDLALPVATLTPIAAARLPGVGGTLRVQVDHLAQVADGLDAQLTLQWSDASVPGPQPDTRIALGAVSIALNGRGAELEGPVRNTGGEVEVSGELALAASGAARLSATLRPRATTGERAAMISGALSTFAAADGAGGYRVNWTGAWR